MTSKTLISVTQITAIFLCLQPVSFAGVYKWEDEKGQVHYTDQPDHPGAEQFNVRNNTTTKPGTSFVKPEDTDGEDSTSTETSTEGRTETESEPKPSGEPKMVEIEPSSAEKKRLCNEAKSDIAAISSRGRMREINEKGEYTYLPEQQRQQRLSAAKKKKREFCR